jgi:type II secretion system protein N
VKRFLIAGLTGMIIVLGFWQIAVPGSLITDLIENSLEDKGLHADFTGFRKGLFFNFESQQITLKKSGASLLSIENARARVNPLSLLVLRLSVLFDGDISRGRMNGRVDLLHGKNRVDITIDKAEMEGISFFRALGLAGSRGIFSGDMKIENSRGEIRFVLANAVFESASFGGITLPLEMFNKARGAMTVNNNTVDIKSFALEGAGIYARIKGNITEGRASLTAELMPERSFKEKNYIFSMLEQYKVSPGYYSIPITSNLTMNNEK